jgi:hypothetical protein
VRDSLQLQQWLDAMVRGERPRMALLPDITLESLADGLGQDDTELLRPTIQALQMLSEYEDARMQARHGAVSLTADGLLPDASVFARKELELHRPGKPASAEKPGQSKEPVQKEPPQHGLPQHGLPQQDPPARSSSGQEPALTATQAAVPGPFSQQISRLSMRQKFGAAITPQR